MAEALPNKSDAKRNFASDNGTSDETRNREFVALAGDDMKPIGATKERGRRSVNASDDRTHELLEAILDRQDQILEALLNVK